MKIIFFGSTSDSVVVLEKLFTFHFALCTPRICAVVTQPARPIGRKHIITPTPVEEWAKSHDISVLSFPHQHEKPWLFQNEQTVINALQSFKADLIISACFGQKIPVDLIRRAKFGGLNVHPSLLPRWRGADPVPWAILSGDRQTGVTIVTLEEAFDQGKIIAQQKYPITDSDTSDPLRTTLFKMGAELLVDTLSDYCSLCLSSRSRVIRGSGDPLQNGIASSKTPRNDKEPYARRLTRADGFIPWELFLAVTEGIDVDMHKRPGIFSLVIGNWSLVIARALRALHPWPGVWTLWKNKRLKLIATKPHVIVQLEGKKPVSYDQFQKAYLPS